MNLIPEWMSNVHPLIVHFPIALLVVAVLTDLAGLLLKRYGWLKPAALWLYVLGALGTIGAYISGKQAADVVNFPTASYSVISTHADLALYTMVFFSVYALLRLLLAWKKWDQKTVVGVLLFVIAAGGLGLIQQTAERGGELVFRFGVGTQVQVKIEETTSPPAAPSNKIAIEENGSWHWQANETAALQFRQNFKLIKGSWDDLTLQAVKTENNEPALNIQTTGQKAFVFAFGPRLKNVEITAQVELYPFKGRFFLTHHIAGPATYDFLAIENKAVRLGRLVQGKVKFFDQGTVQLTKRLTLKVVSSQGHYRGYVNDQLIVHGHGSDLEPGQAGFAFSGRGSIRLLGIKTVSLDSEAPMMNMDTQDMTHDSEQSTHNH